MPEVTGSGSLITKHTKGNVRGSALNLPAQSAKLTGSEKPYQAGRSGPALTTSKKGGGNVAACGGGAGAGHGC